eukprot:CAMPEP_0175066482 /NCGR_PEP_ID=MMETSP0052_2-20121109/16535_1 /TAXON_ID=51329 ORGANISM="Polytomella parva, Strain SAG 63-3" /NCGR_SAMPLE_ID=MMETSP0052_2 /ASSEMBLY_ACC=CAM_ASM_000194 /LENGTH=282 /DNA_ID=CAMNT_0016333193 /DNA_START=50 /DNA_END=898 /DNA_ORIENTATION=-
MSTAMNSSLMLNADFHPLQQQQSQLEHEHEHHYRQSHNPRRLRHPTDNDHADIPINDMDPHHWMKEDLLNPKWSSNASAECRKRHNDHSDYNGHNNQNNNSNHSNHSDHSSYTSHNAFIPIASHAIPRISQGDEEIGGFPYTTEELSHCISNGASADGSSTNRNNTNHNNTNNTNTNNTNTNHSGRSGASFCQKSNMNPEIGHFEFKIQNHVKEKNWNENSPNHASVNMKASAVDPSFHGFNTLPAQENKGISNEPSSKMSSSASLGSKWTVSSSVHSMKKT